VAAIAASRQRILRSSGRGGTVIDVFENSAVNVPCIVSPNAAPVSPPGIVTPLARAALHQRPVTNSAGAELARRDSVTHANFEHLA
jgi:hypothetical protein